MTGATLWVHCGTYKTGSSSIQNHLFGHREALAAAGWLYPLSGLLTDEAETGRRHSGLAYKARAPEERRRLWDDLAREITESDARQVVLSSEVWSRPSAARRLEAMTDRLRRTASLAEVRAVLYLRRRATYARSMYRELVNRRGQALPFAEFLGHNEPLFDPVLLLTRLASAADACEVWPYERAADVTSDFCTRLGIPVPAAAGRRTNVGDGSVLTEARRQLNVIAPHEAASFSVEDLPAHLRGAAATHEERFPAGFFERPRGWYADLGRLAGWGSAEVDAYAQPPSQVAEDVADLSGEIGRAVAAWLATRP